jgi:hypothetical protein
MIALVVMHDIREISVCDTATGQRGTFGIDGVLIRGETLGFSPDEVCFKAWSQSVAEKSERKCRMLWESTGRRQWVARWTA